MIKLGKGIVKYRVVIIILAFALMVPSVFGMLSTRINYDMLTYLPKSMETVKGQDILMDDFGKGAFSFVVVEGMEDKEVSALRKKIEKIDHVDTALWYDSLADISVPKEMLPDKILNAFNSDNSTIIAVFFDTSTSADETMDAIRSIRSVSGKQCFVSGMSALVTDLKDLCEKEEPIYVALAVACACAAMMLFMDNWIIPFIFLISIGNAIFLNLGSNFFLGEISYITKALSAVLQLAVTMDYSIFLWHSYAEQKKRYAGDNHRAMAHAIKATFTSVLGSSITTVAGFIALCFMSFTLGIDLGIVMAKGVILGVIGCVTTLPSLILVCEKLLNKTMHRPLVPQMKKTSAFIVKHSWVFLIIFAIIITPAYIGYQNTNNNLYYDMANSLPKDMQFVIANSKLRDEFDVSTTHMVLCDSNMAAKDAKNMLNEINDVKGVKYSLGLASVVGSLVPKDILPESVVEVLQSDKYQLILINSSYHVASEDVNTQIDSINSIIKKYDKNAMLIGEAPCTKDMIEVTDKDFRVVNTISIAAIFIIIMLVLKSISIPVVLVAVIEVAIFINLGIPSYIGQSLSFIAPICISTIQLGATVDYAILMTTRYKRERSLGNDKQASVTTALCTSMPSIIVSALGFFAATFGVSIYSDIDIISSMCGLMARGAIISMLSVIFVLPAMFMVFDKIIIRTSLGFKQKNKSKGVSEQ